jgi:branched-chain amino acid transport system substrate-binding protein
MTMVLSRVVFALGLGFFGAPAWAQTIKLGALLPLTGPGSVIGGLEREGIQFAVDQANEKGGIRGHKIQMIIQDHQAKPYQAVLDFNSLVDLDQVAAVLCSYSGPTLAIAPLATRKKVLLINSGAQADNLAHASPYLINTLPMIGDEVGVLARYLVQTRGLKRAAILYENDSAGISGRDDFVAAFTKAGGSIVAQERTDFGDTNFRPDLMELAGAKPDVLFVVLTVAAQPLAEQYKQLDLSFPIAGTSFFADPKLIADPSATGWIHTQVEIEAPPDLAADFHRRFHEDMEFHARQWYNGTVILLTAIDKTVAEGKPVTGENIRQAIFEIRNFQGIMPVEFKTNTASAEIDIDEIRAGEDRLLTRLKAE